MKHHSPTLPKKKEGTKEETLSHSLPSSPLLSSPMSEEEEVLLLPHAVPASAPPVFPMMNEQEARATVERNYTLNMLILTLSHGAAFAGRTFAAHQGLLNLLKRAYEEQDSTRFLGVLKNYLEQAQGRVAQVPHAAQIPAILMEVERLLVVAGLPLVARRLLSVQQLPVQQVC